MIRPMLYPLLQLLNKILVIRYISLLFQRVFSLQSNVNILHHIIPIFDHSLDSSSICSLLVIHPLHAFCGSNSRLFILRLPFLMLQLGDSSSPVTSLSNSRHLPLLRSNHSSCDSSYSPPPSLMCLQSAPLLCVIRVTGIPLCNLRQCTFTV